MKTLKHIHNRFFSYVILALSVAGLLSGTVACSDKADKKNIQSQTGGPTLTQAWVGQSSSQHYSTHVEFSVVNGSSAMYFRTYPTAGASSYDTRIEGGSQYVLDSVCADANCGKIAVMLHIFNMDNGREFTAGYLVQLNQGGNLSTIQPLQAPQGKTFGNAYDVRSVIPNI